MIFADTRYNRIDKRSKLPPWITQFITSAQLNLSTEAAVTLTSNFLREMGQPLDRETQIGISLWKEEHVMQQEKVPELTPIQIEELIKTFDKTNEKDNQKENNENNKKVSTSEKPKRTYHMEVVYKKPKEIPQNDEEKEYIQNDEDPEIPSIKEFIQNDEDKEIIQNDEDKETSIISMIDDIDEDIEKILQDDDQREDD